MLREALLHVVSSALTLAVVTVSALAVAWVLGPGEFGRLAAFQAACAMLGPMVALRLDTRIAACRTQEQLHEVLSSTLLCAASFMLVGALLLPLLRQIWPFDLGLGMLAVGFAALACMADALVAAYAFQGRVRQVIAYRAFRQVLPGVGALLAVLCVADFRWAGAGSLLGLVLGLLVSLPPLRKELHFSWSGLRQTLLRYRSGLAASMCLGMLNAVWLNGLLPALNLVGLSQMAGQYAMVQRILGVPLGVISISLNSLLMKGDNALHLARARIAALALGLFAFAGLMAWLIYWVTHVQHWIAIPPRWVLEAEVFWPAIFFLASSFAVGGLSIVSVRLRDEWFLTGWQLLALGAWGLMIWLMPSDQAFRHMLVLGGLAYWVLLARWVLMSRRVQLANR